MYDIDNEKSPNGLVIEEFLRNLDENGENLDNIPFPETKHYVKRILQNYKIYQEIY